MTDADRQLLHQAIRRTLAYYDVFEYPLRDGEVWRWLYRGVGETWEATLAEVQQALHDLVTVKKIETANDMFYLPGRAHLVRIRGERKVRGDRKWRRAKSVARFLEVVPYVKLVAVVNTLAIDNARSESDIDLLIVTEPERIWVTRMMVTGIVEMLGYRRHGDKIKDHVCLSFYLTTRALDLTPLKSAPDDPHFMFWVTQAVPLMDEKTYENFVNANRPLTARLPNAWTWPWQSRLLKKIGILRGIKRFYGRIFGIAAGNYLDALARDNQIKRFEADTESKSKLGTTDVVISEDVLKFHENDRRAKYNALFYERCRALGIQP